MTSKEYEHKSAYQDADASDIQNYTETESGDGYKFNHKIRVNGVLVRPVAVAVQMTADEYYAEIYFPAAGAEEFSENIGPTGQADHYAQDRVGWETALERAEMFARNHKTADSIREAVNAPKGGN